MRNAKALSNGRRELDRQNAESGEVVSTLLRHLDFDDKKGFTGCSFNCANVCWKLQWRDDKSPILSCNIFMSEKRGAGIVFLANTAGIERSAPARYTTRVHASLDELMKFMFKEFPYLESKLEPYFQAAEALE